MFELCVETDFAASHVLRDYVGKCARLHGHNWKVRACVTGQELDHRGLLIDYGDLKREVRDLCEQVDHRHLNDLAPFDQINPTSENVARWMHEQLTQRLAGHQPAIKVSRITIWETERSVCTYTA